MPIPRLNILTDLGMDPGAAGKPFLGRLKRLWCALVGSVIYSIEGSCRSPKVIVRAIKH